MPKWKNNWFISIAIAATLTAAMEGCVVTGHKLVINEPFTEQELEKNHDKIRRGEITKTDILQWFGPPMTVVLPEEKEEIFERFRASTASPQLPLIYFYKETILSRGEFEFDGIFIPTNTTRTEKNLWILIDERNGKVADYIIENGPDNDKSQNPAVHRPRGMP
jgi:hypothetical protein